MSTLTFGEEAKASAGGLSLYRAIWRWHFFAGLLVIPFMLNLAVTGSLYLFKDDIANIFYSSRNVVVKTGEARMPQLLVNAAMEAFPNARLVSFHEPASETSSAIVTLSRGGENTLVYVNPYTAQVLGGVGSKQEFAWVVKRIHSLEYFGSWTNRLIEVVAGFALVLVTTGIYLWWPRKQSGGVMSIRGTPARRVFWRDLHAVTGAIAGVVIFFLAFSGMPWSGFWGANVNAWLTKHDLGTPAALWDDVPKSTKVTQDVVARPGWVVERAPVPLSSEKPSDGAPIGINAAVAIAKGLGMKGGFDVAAPSDATGVYTASRYFGDLGKERTIHIDQYSGKPLVDLSYDQYPTLGKAIEWSINVHQGQEWGRFNQFLMLGTCIAIILSCLSAIVMWWKRRPSGRLGVPPMPSGRSVYGGLYAIAIIFGVAFPLTGAAILVMLLVDLLIIRNIPPLKHVFS